ncbi:MAG TPA: hypothetical protein VEY67_12385 [Candidatus Dormibacteraeota bacterium]|nr:hypothetical protein [Candidatus Dormibacteraeota bacterium]
MDIQAHDKDAVSPDPISWRAARPGTPVHATGGEEAGTLRAVEGDGAADIFHGLVVEVGGREVLVPADAVTTMTSERIDVAMSVDAVNSLDEWSDAGASAAPAGEREAPGTPGPPAL